MRRPRLLDLFCCAGGAAVGYARAGFDVVGVDIVPRPNYPFTQYVADAMTFPLDGFDAIHASPPCQDRSTLTTGTNRARGWGRDHVQLVPPIRRRLIRTGVPFVIEQPTGHGDLIRVDLRLCMDAFPPADPPFVWRHRDFELEHFKVEQPEHVRHSGRVRGWRHGKYHDGDYVAAYGNGGGKATVAEMQHALGIDWTDVREELTEAIPPAYTEHIGQALIQALR